VHIIAIAIEDGDQAVRAVNGFMVERRVPVLTDLPAARHPGLVRQQEVDAALYILCNRIGIMRRTLMDVVRSALLIDV
jgi:hypothetical protein